VTWATGMRGMATIAVDVGVGGYAYGRTVFAQIRRVRQVLK